MNDQVATGDGWKNEDLHFDVVEVPSRFANTAAGSVTYHQVKCSAGLLGYLWFSDAEGAAGFVPAVSAGLDGRRAKIAWVQLLQEEKAAGQSPSAAVGSLGARSRVGPGAGVVEVSPFAASALAALRDQAALESLSRFLDRRVLERIAVLDTWVLKAIDRGKSLTFGDWEIQWFVTPQGDGSTLVEESERGHRKVLFSTDSRDAVDAYALLQAANATHPRRPLAPSRLSFDPPSGVTLTSDSDTLTVSWGTWSARFPKGQFISAVRFAQLVPYSLEEVISSCESPDGSPAFIPLDDYVTKFGEAEQANMVVDYESRTGESPRFSRPSAPGIPVD